MKEFLDKYENKIAAMLTACGILFLYCRNRFGIDITDEAYYLGSVKQVIQGKIPMMSIWDGRTGFFLSAPFLYIAEKMFSSSVGIVLLNRQLSTTFFLILGTINVYVLLERYKEVKRHRFIVLISYFVVVVLLISYNNVIGPLTTTSLLLLCSEKEQRAKWKRTFIAGILCGIGCLYYPTMSVIPILLFIYLLCNKNITDKKSKIVAFCLGVGGVACLFFTWIFLNGSFDELEVAIHHMVRGQKSGFKDIFDYGFFYNSVLLSLAGYIKRNGLRVLIYSLIAVATRILKQENNIWIQRLFFSAYAILIFGFDIRLGEQILTILIGFLVMNFMTGRKFSDVIKGEKNIFLLCAVVIVFIGTYTSSVGSFIMGLGIAAPLLGMYIILVLCDEMRDCSDGYNEYALCLVGICLALSGIMQTYGFVQADDIIIHYNANTKVERGTFAGIYTTAWNKEKIDAFQNLCDDISKMTDSGSAKLTVVTFEPVIYLMTDAEIYIPWCFRSTEQDVIDYFNQYGDYPDIIYSDSSKIMDNRMQINELINDKYELVIEREIPGSYDAFVYKLK